jgi:hypothetical protein
MRLTEEQVKESLKSPSKKATIERAIKHENRLRFHVESYMEPTEAAQPLTVFLDWVRTLIPKDKFNIFVSLFRFPQPTLKITGAIFSELERVFESKNPSHSYKFTDPTFREDWEEYRKEELKYPQVWRKKGWDAMKTSINSVLIVDLPTEQAGEYPDPYFYFLPIEDVIDFKTTGEDIDWIIFKQKDNKIAVFDGESFRVYALDKDGNIKGEPEEALHDLGFCPARFFWSTALSQKDKNVKKSPLSPELSALDWLLFFGVSKKHLDLYAPYPIYSAYKADCNFENNETGNYCDGGFLRDDRDQFVIYGQGEVMPCPVCAEKRLAGVGSFIEVPIPEKDEPDLRDPITITSVDRESLDYNVEEVERLSKEIFSSVVGSGGSVQEKAAINEMQVAANFESRTSVLNNLKGNFESARKFVDDTICALRYGENYLGSSISMGTEFYMHSAEDLSKQFKSAKERGAPEAELDTIADQIISTQYKNNPTQMQRMLILKHLEPYRHFSFTELMKLKESGLLNKELLKVKINFSTFVDQFERENTDVVDFASQIGFDQKIKIISEKLKEYASNQEIDPIEPIS